MVRPGEPLNKCELLSDEFSGRKCMQIHKESVLRFNYCRALMDMNKHVSTCW